jgi:hypothetical protein
LFQKTDKGVSQKYPNGHTSETLPYAAFTSGRSVSGGEPGRQGVCSFLFCVNNRLLLLQAGFFTL